MHLNKVKISNVFIIGYLFLLSVVFVTFFSNSTSPLFDSLGADSSIFRLIGSAMAEGKTLYVDIFDHKGPMLFFIQYLSQVLYSGRLGVYILQILFLFGSLFFIYKLSRLFLEKRVAWLLPLVALYFLELFYQGGNLSEEFSALFNFSVVYMLVSEVIKPTSYAGRKLALSGAFLGVLFLLRMNNAAPMLAVLLSYGIILYRSLGFTAALKQMSHVVSGFLVIVLLTCIYFVLNGSFTEMLYATFLFNFQYSDFNLLNIPNLIHSGYFFWSIASILICTLGGLIYYLQRKDWRILLLSTTLGATSFLVTFISTTGYYHYLQLTLPAILFGIILLLTILPINKKWTIGFLALIGVAIIINIIYSGINNITKSASNERTYSAYRSTVAAIPYDQRDNVFGYNTPSAFWISTNLFPSYRYYTLQDWWCVHDPKICTEVVSYLRESPPSWIVVDIDTVRNKDVKKIITSNYTFVPTNGNMDLYTLDKDK